MLYLFVGTLNRPAPYFAQANGPGLVVLGFDEQTLRAEQCCVASDVDNPTFLTVPANGTRIYATSEVFGWKEGVVSAYAFDPATRSLTYLNKQPTLGSIAAHVSLDRAGRQLYVANYGMGEGGPDQSVAAFSLRDDGSISPALASMALEGAVGPDNARQERSHAHCVVHLDDGSVLVADLGTDSVYRLRLTGERLEVIARVVLPPGSGPRHIALSPDGRIAYVLNELASSVTSLALDDPMPVLGTAPIFANDPGTGTISADIHCSADGRFVYTSSRGADCLTVFRSEGRKLELLQQLSCGGRTPRNFALTPSGRHLLVANQDSDTIAIFARDAGDGQLTDTGERIAIGTPMCIQPASLA